MFNGMPRHAPNNNPYMPYTNKVFVVSLEDALSRWTEYNSEMVYFDQNKDVLYNICTDGRGQKTYTVVDLKIHVQENERVSDTCLKDLNKRIDEIDKKLEDLYGKYNAKQTGSTVSTEPVTT